MRENAVGELVVMGVRGEVWVVRWVVRELHPEVHTWSVGVCGPGFWLSAPPSWGLWRGWVFGGGLPALHVCFENWVWAGSQAPVNTQGLDLCQGGADGQKRQSQGAAEGSRMVVDQRRGL